MPESSLFKLSSTTGGQPHHPLAALDIFTLIFINMIGYKGFLILICSSSVSNENEHFF